MPLNDLPSCPAPPSPSPCARLQGHKLYVVGTTSLPASLQRDLHLTSAFNTVLTVPTLQRSETGEVRGGEGERGRDRGGESGGIERGGVER